MCVYTRRTYGLRSPPPILPPRDIPSALPVNQSPPLGSSPPSLVHLLVGHPPPSFDHSAGPLLPCLGAGCCSTSARGGALLRFTGPCGDPGGAPWGAPALSPAWKKPADGRDVITTRLPSLNYQCFSRHTQSMSLSYISAGAGTYTVGRPHITQGTTQKFLEKPVAIAKKADGWANLAQHRNRDIPPPPKLMSTQVPNTRSQKIWPYHPDPKKDSLRNHTHR